MKIKTITCHDVYNVGASLQAFALQEYLRSLGHDVEIIDYKPEYLNRHYSLTAVNNPKYRKPLLRETYILLKLPKRLRRRKSEKKAAFDQFTEKYLKTTAKRYKSNEDLKRHCPDADIYFAGSDQIWNPLFQNGKDPAFFLDFVPQNKVRASYAASFAVEEISKEDQVRMRSLLSRFDHISVRESSALKILDSMHITGTQVCDPIFLMNCEEWKRLLTPYNHTKKYIFVYDFDSNQTVHQRIRDYADQNDLDIVSFFPFTGGRYIKNLGPCEFLGVIAGAEMVISNSFHATAFSLIFHIPFLVFNRQENINTRMKDLITYFGVDERVLINSADEIAALEYDWETADRRRSLFVKKSKEYINTCTKGR